MKKYTLLIALGGFLLIAGIILSMNKKGGTTYYYEKELTTDEATALILEKVKNVVDVYENPKTIFNVVNNKSKEPNDEEEMPQEDTNEYLNISNYDEVIDNLYTEKGKKELESIKFKEKLFVDKKDDSVSILSSIPKSNSYLSSSITISDVKVNSEEIKATVTFSRDELKSDDVLTYYVYEKNMVLIKNEDKWLIDTFIYTNS